MNGMAVVQQRIDAIESRFAPPKSVPADDGRSEDFGAVMAEADERRQLRSFGAVGSAHAQRVAHSSGPRRIGDTPAMSPGLRSAFEEAAARYGLDVELLMAVSWQESAFNPTAVSHAGAIGLMQLMPGTAAGLGVDPRDPLQNIDGGARYLRQQLDRFQSVELALAAYNAGPGAVQKHGGIPPFAETQAYVPSVIARWGRIAAGGAPPVLGPVPGGTAAVPTPVPVPAQTAAVTTPTPVPVEQTTPVPASPTTPVVAPAAPEVATAPPAVSVAPVTPAAEPVVDIGAMTPPSPPGPTATAVAGVPTALDQAADGTADQPDSAGAVPIAGAGPAPAAPAGVAAVSGTVSAQEVPAEILRLVRQDGGTIRMQLSPQGLGDVSVQVSLTAAGDIAVEIRADTDQAVAVLGRLRDTVESALRIDGYSLDSFDVASEREQPDHGAEFATTDTEPGEQSSPDAPVAPVDDPAVSGDSLETDAAPDDTEPSVLRI